MRAKRVRVSRTGNQRLGLELLENRQLLTASYLDSIGWSSLKAILGPAMPTGAGIGVSQIEHREQNNGGYKPDVNDADFAGKTISIKSSTTLPVSQHATRVGEHLYGLSSGVAPGITAVDSWEVENWDNVFLKNNTTVPPLVETRKIENHSWDGGSSGGSASDLESARRFDYLVDRDNIFAAIAVGNQGNLTIPKVLSSTYNGIVVGLSNGTANRGLTSFDGSGRAKPDIVAPEATSSQATPQVSGTAALLLDQIGKTNWSAQNKADAQESTALKAMLLAGTTKSQFGIWSRTPDRPIDVVYGAGQLNVYNSYDILTAGEQEPGVVGLQGWDSSRTAAAGTNQTYTFTIPSGTAVGEMSLALTWNRSVTSGLVGAFGNLQSTLANLNLTLNRVSGGTVVPVDSSVSTDDNVEYLYLKNLPAGTYEIGVSSDTPDVKYGLAWNAPANLTFTGLLSSPGTVLAGQNVTFTASVSAANGNAGFPTGSVTFFDGVTPLDSRLLSVADGVARVTYSTTTLSAGSHVITAKYAGQGDFASSSASVTVYVGSTVPAVAISANPPSSTYGQPITLTADVTGIGANPPTGSFKFKDGGVLLGIVPAIQTQIGGQGMLTVASLSAGSHNITATYFGDPNVNTIASKPQKVTVTTATSSTSLVSDIATSVFGQVVTLTATATSLTGTPVGTVTFKKGLTVLGTSPLVNGKATFTTTTLPIGVASLFATYEGNTNFASSSSSNISVTVNKADSSTAVSSDLPTAQPTQAVTLTAIVSPTAPGAGVPTGNVTFKDGATILGVTALVNGQATWTVSTLTPGVAHTIKVLYAGDANFKSNTSPDFVETIAPLAPTTTTLAADINPAVFGQTVSFTATIASSGAAPTGTVTFKKGAVVLATVDVVNSQATYTTNSLNAGNISLVAVYSGNTTIAGSTSAAFIETISKAGTVINVTSNAPSAVVGDSITFTAVVLPVAPGAGVPTGTVTFRDGNTVLGTATLVNGQATFTISTLTAGTHSIKVAYGGSTSYLTSTSGALTQTVSAPLPPPSLSAKRASNQNLLIQPISLDPPQE